MTEVSLLKKMLLLVALFSVLITLFVTPYVLSLFRRKVAASMNRSAQAGDVLEDEVLSPLPTPSTTEPILSRVRSGASLCNDLHAQELSRQARAKLQRIAFAYACGGLAHAAIMTMAVIAVTANSGILAAVLSIFMVMALPVVPTIALVLATRLRVRALWLAGAMLLALAIAGEASALVWALFALYILIPGLIFLILNVRYWRAAAPLIMLFALGASVGWLTLMEIGKAWGVSGTVIWAFRLAGLVAGFAMTLPLAQRLGTYYKAKRTSELMLFIDIWWLLLTLIQTAILVVVGDNATLLFALLGYIAFWLISRTLIGSLRNDDPPKARLLLLRVFGHDRRTERLLDELCLRWRPLGTVALIAARDLAYRNIDPRELYGFLNGALSREFIKDEQHLAERLSQRDERQDPDGLYRISQFFCHRNTWKPTLDALVAGNDAVLMDLRGFGPRHSGCQYEIKKLAEHIGSKPIVLLTDSNEGIALTESLFVEAVPTERRALLQTGGHVFLLQAEGSLSKTVETAIALLVGSRPAT